MPVQGRLHANPGALRVIAASVGACVWVGLDDGGGNGCLRACVQVGLGSGLARACVRILDGLLTRQARGGCATCPC